MSISFDSGNSWNEDWLPLTYSWTQGDNVILYYFREYAIIKLLLMLK